MTYEVFKSSDSNVSKFVFTFPKTENRKEAVVESVLYKYNDYSERTVICCSVQSGCPVGCSFCGTGKFFIRNLTSSEIFDQIKVGLSHIDCNPNEIKKFQIMFMSMGEPFLTDVDQFHHAIRRLHEEYPNAQLLVSTSAPEFMVNRMPEFIRLSKEIPNIGLQFSVHESTDFARKKLIPTNTSTLRQIAVLGELWAAYTGRQPFFNYCVHENNCYIDDADRLLKLFDPDVWEVTLSVICQKDETVHNSIERQLSIIEDFNKYLIERGFSTRVFNPAGQDDIGGGCGQLWWFQDWLNKNGKSCK
jgi:23S rRNA (adenine2503-C2)-methyltransferase